MCPGREEVKNRITTAEVGGNTTFVNQWSLANAWFKIIVNWIHYLPNDRIANNHCYWKIIISPGVQHKWQHELELQLHPTRHQGRSRPKVINFFSLLEVVLFVFFMPAWPVFSDLPPYPKIRCNMFAEGARIYQSAVFQSPQSSLEEILAQALAST